MVFFKEKFIFSFFIMDIFGGKLLMDFKIIVKWSI